MSFQRFLDSAIGYNRTPLVPFWLRHSRTIASVTRIDEIVEPRPWYNEPMTELLSLLIALAIVSVLARRERS